MPLHAASDIFEASTAMRSPVMPFIFRYLTSTSSALPLCTDPTGGAETEGETGSDKKVKKDYADDSDVTDDGSNPQTGLLADYGTKDDEA